MYLGKTIFVCSVVALLLGCTPHHVNPQDQNNNDKLVGTQEDCPAACANLEGAKCEEGDPSPKKRKPCLKWCSSYHDPKTGLPPWSGCVAAAGTDPDKIEACNMKCTRKHD